MSRMSVLLAAVALVSPLAAEDFGPVVKAMGVIYEGKTHFGVACNYARSQNEVADLHRALPDGSRLTVVDVRHPMQVGAASSVLRQRGVELLALIPNDPLIHDGSSYATTLVRLLGDDRPAFGTTPAAMKNGCALALGRATNWEPVINARLLDPNVKGRIWVEGAPMLPGTMRGPNSLNVIRNDR